MIDVRTFLLFLAAAIAVIVAPGPDILYVLSRGISGGRRVGTVSALGIAFGEVLHTLLAVLGLAALLQASMAAFLVVKYLGAAYLVYLGVRTIMGNDDVALQRYSIASPWTVFRQGVLTNLFNPKAQVRSSRRTGPYASMSKNPRHPPATTRSPHRRIPFERGAG